MIEMETKQTAVDWLNDRFLFAGYATPSEWKDQAKAMEKEQEFETKLYWFGKGILAGRENRIKELKPKRN